MRIAGTVTAERDVLTARARLREAAIECFAVDGFDVSVRTIAARADVTAGLVRHHFGSKEALRAECDEHVLSTVHRLKSTVIESPGSAFLGQLAQAEEYSAYALYILRSVRDGGPAGQAFLEHMILDAQRYVGAGVESGLIKPSRDPEGRIRLLTLESIGGMIIALSHHPEITLDNFPQVMTKIMTDHTLARLELYTDGLFTDRSMLEKYLLYISDPPEERLAPYPSASS